MRCGLHDNVKMQISLSERIGKYPQLCGCGLFGVFFLYGKGMHREHQEMFHCSLKRKDFRCSPCSKILVSVDQTQCYRYKQFSTLYKSSVTYQCTPLPAFPLNWRQLAQILSHPFMLRELIIRAVDTEGKLRTLPSARAPSLSG